MIAISYKCIFFLIAFTLIEALNPNLNNTTFSWDKYREKICNFTDTCNSTETLPIVYKHLMIRNCMCDEKCSEYNDCCEDAPYKNSIQQNFQCVSTYYNGSIYMKTICSNNYPFNQISKNCKKTDFNSTKKNILFGIPVTNEDHVVYKNLFCALCNGENNFQFWDIALTSKHEEQFSTLNDEMFWKNYTTEKIEDYFMNAVLPTNMDFVRSCIPRIIQSCDDDPNICFNYTKVHRNSNCLPCNRDNDTFSGCGLSNTIENIHVINHIVEVQDLPINRHCDLIPRGNSAYDKLCKSAENTDALDYIDSCFYHTLDGKPCLINSFFINETEFKLIDDETIFVYRYNSNFSIEEWDYQDENIIFLCGTEIPRSKEEIFVGNINSVLTTILIKASLLFLMIYFIMYRTSKRMRYPLGKVLLMYNITLFFVLGLFDIAELLPSCKISAAVIHYLFLSCFTWLSVTSYDCWRIITSNVTFTNEKSTKTRFTIYCLIGWISPLTIMAVAVYFELSPVQIIPCNLKPGYGRLNQCFIAHLYPSLYFFNYPSTVLFSINILFFLRIFSYIMFNSSSHRNLCIFFKLALITGIPWTIGIAVTWTSSLYVRIIYTILNSSQGIFIFFAFAYDKETFKTLLKRIIHKRTQNPSNSVTFTRSTARQVSQYTEHELT